MWCWGCRVERGWRGGFTALTNFRWGSTSVFSVVVGDKGVYGTQHSSGGHGRHLGILVCSLIHLPTHTLTHTSTHSPTHTLHPSTPPPHTHTHTHSTHPPTHTHLHTHTFAHSPTHIHTPPIHPHTHMHIHPPTYTHTQSLYDFAYTSEHLPLKFTLVTNFPRKELVCGSEGGPVLQELGLGRKCVLFVQDDTEE